MAFSLYARGGTSGSGSGGGTPDPDNTKFYPGIYVKVMDFMNNSTNFPATFVDTDTTSIYGHLNRETWFRGLLYPCDWGAIETSQGVYNWTVIDNIMDMVGNPNSSKNIFNVSGRDSARNKKVLLLLNTKSFSETAAAVDDLIPGYLQATGTAYANGMVRYHRLIGFESTQGQTGAFVQGYHIRWPHFKNGLTGNDSAGAAIYTLRDAFQAFLTALNERYKNHPAFAGIVMTEPIPVSTSIVDLKYGAASPDYSRDPYFDGRLQWLKNIKQIFTTVPVIEMPTFDNPYMQAMTNNNAADGCVVNKLGIGGPNFHNGTNLQSIINAKDFAAGKVVVCNQCQPLDMDSKTGYFVRANTAQNPAPNDVFNFPSAPNTVIENPNWNSSGQLISQDVPDFQFIMDKAIYLKTNIFIYQYEIGNSTTKTTVGGVTGNKYNWTDFVSDMNGTKGTNYISPNTGSSVKDDPCGGMISTLPTDWV